MLPEKVNPQLSSLLSNNTCFATGIKRAASDVNCWRCKRFPMSWTQSDAHILRRCGPCSRMSPVQRLIYRCTVHVSSTMRVGVTASRRTVADVRVIDLYYSARTARVKPKTSRNGQRQHWVRPRAARLRGPCIRLSRANSCPIFGFTRITPINSWPTFSPYLYNRVWSELTCRNTLPFAPGFVHACVHTSSQAWTTQILSPIRAWLVHGHELS